jgi:hypothetical protein
MPHTNELEPALARLGDDKIKTLENGLVVDPRLRLHVPASCQNCVSSNKWQAQSSIRRTGDAVRPYANNTHSGCNTLVKDVYDFKSESQQLLMIMIHGITHCEHGPSLACNEKEETARCRPARRPPTLWSGEEYEICITHASKSETSGPPQHALFQPAKKNSLQSLPTTSRLSFTLT